MCVCGGLVTEEDAGGRRGREGGEAKGEGALAVARRKEGEGLVPQASRSKTDALDG